MCLSTAWELDSFGEKKMLCEYVAGLSVTGNTITLTDLMGNEVSVSGTLRGVDLIKNTITISAAPATVQDKPGTVKRYERIREIFNNCNNSQMRDVDIREVETDDVDRAVGEFCRGKEVSCEKFVKPDGSIVFEINIDGLAQRVSYMELGV
ncbi:MAG: CooT family nickel-binding protein [Spirochaetaceae bacterium]|jgi:predicted RNA-binding protein|nr:CooT family nickel-binding protein [Spirochaetaceae bacterium]